MCDRARRTTGLTLIEMTLVLATVAVMVGFAVPAVRSLVDSFQSKGGAQSMVGAALSSARAMAVSHQRYVGVRFQKLCTSDDPLAPLKGLADAPQYMVFIMHEEYRKMGDLENGFRAVEGLEPIKLPDTMGVMDLSRVTDDTLIDEPAELSDATTFSIVFAPSGRLIVHGVRVRNRDGQYAGSTTAVTSMDDVFNSVDNICRSRQGMFIQDDYSRRNGGAATAELGLGEEDSRMGFVIYERSLLKAAYEKQVAWSQYLSRLAAETIYVSPYTGTLISSD